MYISQSWVSQCLPFNRDFAGLWLQFQRHIGADKACGIAWSCCHRWLDMIMITMIISKTSTKTTTMCIRCFAKSFPTTTICGGAGGLVQVSHNGLIFLIRNKSQNWAVIFMILGELAKQLQKRPSSIITSLASRECPCPWLSSFRFVDLP